MTEIDIKPLEEALSKRFNLPIQLTMTIGKSRFGNERVSIESQNLKDHAGIMSSIYEELRITDFGSEFFDSEEGKKLWMGINFSFRYLSGGSNGTNIGNCWYNLEKNTWMFEL